MGLLKYLLKENTIRSNNVLLIVDIQPEYESSINFNISDFIEYMSEMYNSGKDIIYLYNGYDTLGMVKENELKGWLYESSEYNESYESFIFYDITYYDKGYAFFRYCMDEGIEDEATVALIKQMMEWGEYDSRELNKDFWIEFVTENRDHLSDIEEVRELIQYSGDMISIPDLMDELKGLNNITLVGGGLNECLREVEIALKVLDKTYTINNEFTF